MNGTTTTHSSSHIANSRPAKPPPAGPAPPAPVSAPPNPPNRTVSSNTANTGPVPPLPAATNATTNGGHHHHHHHHAPNGTNSNGKPKKKPDTPVDPAVMYESLKSRIAVLEEEEVIEEEEERRFAEEAQISVKGMEDNAIHAKYIELFAELKRVERDHAKEKQKLTKDKDAAKSQLSKANQTKNKMENLARELQKDNKKLREDGKKLSQSIEDAQDEIAQMKSEMVKRKDKDRVLQDSKYRDMPEIVVKVVCRYRAELFFKISRKTKLSRLFNAWTDRMERTGGKRSTGGDAGGGGHSQSVPNGPGKASEGSMGGGMQFVFTHNGRSVEPDTTPEDEGMEDGDEIVAVELMDLTDIADDLAEEIPVPHREKLKRNWTADPEEAKRSIADIFDRVVRERLKEVLRQYELRERHFECVIRSKELEVLLSRARAAEQKQLVEGTKSQVEKLEEEINLLRKDLEESQNGQTILIDKLLQCCKEIRNERPNAERTQQLFASLRDELERRAPKLAQETQATVSPIPDDTDLSGC